MAISYKKLYKLLIDKDMKKGDLKAITGLSYSTLMKLENGENVTVDVLDRICVALKCQLNDIAEVIIPPDSTYPKDPR